MALPLILVALLLLGLALFQAWTLWYLKREAARLDQRLDESLDDQDLLEFQERLQALLQQARAAGNDLVQSVERRQEALEKTLVLVREAEKKLVARAQVLEKSAEALALRAEKLRSGPAKKTAKSRPGAAKPALPLPEKPRSYLVRPAPETDRSGETKAPTPAPATPAPKARHQKVYDLADQGLDRDQIAKASGLLPGEVELILNLRPKGR